MTLMFLGPLLAWSIAGCGTSVVDPSAARPPDEGGGPAASAPSGLASAASSGSATPGDVRALPPPDRRGGMPLAEALDRRRSVRSFAAAPLDDRELGQLLWAAQGATGEGRRTAPSAGATYPLEVLVATAQGLFRYLPREHALRAVDPTDLRPALADAALEQEFVATAPAVMIITAVTERTAARYGAERARRYVVLEAGHAAQNLLLAATALGLGSVPVGAFDDRQLARLLGLAAGEEPLYLLPVGHPGD